MKFKLKGKEYYLNKVRIVLIIGVLILLFSYAYYYDGSGWYDYTEYFAIVMVYGMLLMQLNPIELAENKTRRVK